MTAVKENNFRNMQCKNLVLGITLVLGIIALNSINAIWSRAYQLQQARPNLHHQSTFLLATFTSISLIFAFPIYAFIGKEPDLSSQCDWFLVVSRNAFQARPLSFGLTHALSLFGPGVKACSLKPLLITVLPLAVVYYASVYLSTSSLVWLTNKDLSVIMGKWLHCINTTYFVFEGSKYSDHFQKAPNHAWSTCFRCYYWYVLHTYYIIN